MVLLVSLQKINVVVKKRLNCMKKMVDLKVMQSFGMKILEPQKE